MSGGRNAEGTVVSVAGSREQLIARTFVQLSDSLVDDFDVADFLHTLASGCAELLGAAETGVVLSDALGHLQVMASSSERARHLDLFELQNQEGPCLDACRSGEAVLNADIDDGGRWPAFSARARAVGFRSSHAVPLRLRDQVIGALNVFRTEAGALSETDALLAQALADVATIAIIQDRALHGTKVLAEQLQSALNSRVTIEQAKGVLAERHRIDTDQAFRILRSNARNRNRRLGELAREVVLGEADFDLEVSAPPNRG